MTRVRTSGRSPETLEQLIARSELAIEEARQILAEMRRQAERIRRDAERMRMTSRAGIRSTSHSALS